ncbi:hypothetical protein ABZ953_13205 [Streptomyces sp. NPDC046465]|uniref:hypothetical protein n=1 Tax=Streptomyces sp. NPDC046465 TaxID=3155810 RepID=UPI0034020DC9
MGIASAAVAVGALAVSAPPATAAAAPAPVVKHLTATAPAPPPAPPQPGQPHGRPAGELATTGDSRALLYGGIAVALCVLGVLLIAAGRRRRD